MKMKKCGARGGGARDAPPPRSATARRLKNWELGEEAILKYVDVLRGTDLAFSEEGAPTPWGPTFDR